MADLTIRKASWKDAPWFMPWLQMNKEKNCVDWGILDYPTLAVFAAGVDGNTVAYLPVHQVAMLESYAPDPAAATGEKARAAIELVGHIEKEAAALGLREVWYPSSDERTDRFMEQLGYERFTAYRKKVMPCL